MPDADARRHKARAVSVLPRPRSLRKKSGRPGPALPPAQTARLEDGITRPDQHHSLDLRYWRGAIGGVCGRGAVPVVGEVPGEDVVRAGGL